MPTESAIGPADQLKLLAELRGACEDTESISELHYAVNKLREASVSTDFAAIAAHVERLECDAARYRRLRERATGFEINGRMHWGVGPFVGETFEAAVDAAMGADA